MADYLQQHQAFLDAHNQNQMRLQNLEQAKVKGITAAKAEEASTRELMKIRSRATWAGLKIMLVVSLVILFFLYTNVFAQDKRMFWVLTVILIAMLIWKFVEVVREDGALAIGHLGS